MVNLALVGVGKWGRNYLKTISTLSDVSIKYVCSKSQETLDLLEGEYIKTTDLEDILRDETIDGVILATPGSTHFALSEKILDAGMNLLVEKPMALSIIDANKLYKLWQIKKTKVLVSHTQIYSSVYQKAKQLTKEIGSIIKISFQGLNSPARRDMSVIWDWGPHPVSLCLDLIAERVIELSCKGFKSKEENYFSSAEINLLFQNQIKAEFKISWVGEEKKRLFSIYGSEGNIVIDDMAEKHKIQFQRFGHTGTSRPDYGLELPLTNEIREFIEAINNNNQIISGIELGVKVTEILALCEKSASTGGKILKIA